MIANGKVSFGKFRPAVRMTKRSYFFLGMLLLLLIGGGGLFFTSHLIDAAARTVHDDAAAAGEILSLSLQNEMGVIDRGVEALAGSPYILPVLLAPTPARLAHANSALDRYGKALGASVSFLMDRHGRVVAASNRFTPQSFVGLSLAFRPYFQQARKGEKGLWLALGTHTGERGFYAAYPVRNARGDVMGVVAMKNNLAPLEDRFHRYEWFLIDRHGIVFLSSRREAQLQSLWPLETNIQAEIIRSRQFGPGPFHPFLNREVRDGDRMNREGGSYHIRRFAHTLDGWSVVVFWPRHQIEVYRNFGFMTTAAMCLIACGLLLIIYWNQKTALRISRSEDRYRQLFDRMTSGVAVYEVRGDGEDFVFVDFNQAATRISKISREKVLGKSVLTMFPAVREMGLFDVFCRVWRSGEAERHPLSLYRDRRITQWVENQVYKLPTGEIVAVYDDVTEKMKMEEELRERERNYRNIFENAIEGIFQTTPAGRYRRVNPAFAVMFGYDSPEEMISAVTDIGRQLYVDPRDRERLIALMASTQGIVRDFRVNLRRKDGSLFLVSINARLVRDEQSGETTIEGTCMDITEAVATEERYRSIFENAQEGIFRSTPAGKIILANQAMAAMFGYDTPEEFIANVNDVAVQLYARPEERGEILNEIAARGFVKNRETKMCRKDGSHFWVSMTMHAIRDAEGKLLFLEGIDTDITEWKLLTERLRKALGITVQAINAVVGARDPYTKGHQHRVADLACAIAREMGLSGERIEGIHMAGKIHDIGKISVPAEILSTPRKLTAIEFSLIKTHPQAGYDILKDIDFPWPLARMILEHHERWDGSGYPQGLRGDQVMLESRILAVADVVESIASHRPYRPAKGMEEAMAEISAHRGVLYDDAVVAACLRLFRERGYRLVKGAGGEAFT